MPKRRRLFTPNKYKTRSVHKIEIKNEKKIRDRDSARGRFQGALMDVLDPITPSDESDHTPEEPVKSERQEIKDGVEYLTDEEVKKAIAPKSPPRQSYVLKLFDRSVDLSQFQDDSPLYPICRAWMVNQPKANYYENESRRDPEERRGSVVLPGPEGPPVPKIPELLPEQLPDKDSINLDYEENPPPTREELLRMHMPRWAAVKQAWQDQIMLKEARYESTQQVLNRINLEYPSR